MGEWYNGGIARKTIAVGIDVTIWDGNLEAKNVREQRSNNALCSVLFGAARVFDGVHFYGSPIDDSDRRSDACNKVAVTCAFHAATSSQNARPV